MTDIHLGLPLPRRVYAIIAVFCGSMVLSMDIAIAAVVLPTIAEQLNISDAKAVIFVTLYQLILAMTLLPLSALANRLGMRKLYCLGLLLHAAGGLLILTTESYTAALMARSLQAIGTAAGLSVAIGLVRYIYPSQHLGKGMSLNTVANAGGTSLAPAIGGYLAASVDWRWVFCAIVPLSAIALAMFKTIPKPEIHPGRFDGKGSLLCALSIGAIIIGVELAVHGGQVLAGALTAALGLAVGYWFVRHELAVENPVLPLDMLANPKLSLALLANFLATLAGMLIILYLPFYLQNSLGYGPSQVGSVLAIYATASLLFAPTSGYLSDKVSIELLCSLGMLVSLVGLCLMIFAPQEMSLANITWRLWLIGAGVGMFFSPNARMIIGSVALARSAAAASLITTGRTLGQTAGASCVAVLLVLQLSGGPAPFILAAVLVVATLIITLTRPR
ncbi:MFS transporter [Halioxenophilus aromaticivorans]|uniref:MFS transporter n=1 Tax=Halioxenophilus aromaticivorans TaxID=1306992 RepID=A0AAV3U9B6_9ALTE